MSVLGIYGAGGLGREIFELASIINKCTNKWGKIVFIVDGVESSIISGTDVFEYEVAKEQFGSELEIVLAIGEPSTRERLITKIVADGISTPSLIHPNVSIPDSTSIGVGVVIQQGCFVSCNVTIKDYVYLQPQCNIGHDDFLDEGCMLSGLCNLGGLVRIGKWSYVGLSTAIKQKTSVGDYAIVGMGSVVLKDIPSEMIAMGNPARPIARNEERRVFK